MDNSHEYLKRNAEDPDIYDCYPQSEKFLSPVNIKTHKKLLELSLIHILYKIDDIINNPSGHLEYRAKTKEDIIIIDEAQRMWSSEKIAFDHSSKKVGDQYINTYHYDRRTVLANGLSEPVMVLRDIYKGALESNKTKKMCIRDRPKWDPFFGVFWENQYLMYQVIQEKEELHKRFEACYRDNLHSIWAGQELYRPGNIREESVSYTHLDVYKRQGMHAMHPIMTAEALSL